MRKIFGLLLLLLSSFAFSQSNTLTGTGCFPVTVDDKNTVFVTVTGSWSGTIQPKGIDAVGNSYNLQVTPITGTAQNTITANGAYFTSIGGLTQFSVCGASVTGTATVNLNPTVRTFTVPAASAGSAVTQSGTWNVRNQDGSGNALTSNSTTYTAKFGLDSNLLGTLGTAFSTPGKVDVVGTLNTQPSGFTSVLGTQQAVTASAVALATNSVHGVCVKALSTNTIDVFVGPSGVTTGTGFNLSAGDSACYQISNTNLLFVIASTTGASISWTAN